MKKRPSDWGIEQYELQNRVNIPFGIKNPETFKKFDNLIDSRNETGLSMFFKDTKNFPGVSDLSYLSNELKSTRNVYLDDSCLIKNIVQELKNTNKEITLSSSIGNFYQIQELYKEIQSPEISKKIKVAIFFWEYLVIVESTINDLAYLFYKIACSKQDNKFIQLYQDAIKKNEHLMLGQLKDFAIKWKFTNQDSKTFLHKNNLRDSIAHANIYYDDVQDKIHLRGRKYLSFEEFFNEFIRVFDFLKELIFQLNNQDNDLVKKTEKILKTYSKLFLQVSRSGIKKQQWKSSEYAWDK